MRLLRVNRRAWICLSIAMPLTASRGEDGAAFFAAKVLPVLERRCYECHSHSAKLKGGLALDSKAGWLAGGDHGEVLVPGDPKRSRIVEAVRYTNPDFEMPPKGRLPPEEIDIIEHWVSLGAPDSRPAIAPATASRVIDVTEGRKIWAFQPVRDHRPPAVRDTAWPGNDIDRFILARQESAGLHPSPDADPCMWLRRVSLDLTGLPPSPAEISDFLKAGGQARAAVVDRLLGSPAFGERWARHWLDLVGYADQIGTSNNVFAEHAWRYRDYVIAAFNSDKPFDAFIREQIAGDLMPASSPGKRAEQITATGFLVLGDVEIVAVDKLKMEHDLVDQQVSKTGTAFLGMTLGCVRCHDHKFDPIALQDYYAMAGIFRSTSSTYKTDNGVWSSVNKESLPETPAQTASRLLQQSTQESMLASLRADLAEAKARKEDAKGLNARIEHATFFMPSPPKAFGVHDVTKPADMRITIRGNPHALGDAVPRGALRVASWAAFPPIPPGQSGRLQLADWLADARNPLTARVAVNRVWQKLFGEGIVRTVDYFGTRGEKPTHPELLDYLATRFIRSGWSQKQLIRAIVLSHAYRQGSLLPPGADDPDNRLLTRMNRQRLDAEAIRDAMLAATEHLAACGGGTALPLEYPENVTSLSPRAVNPPAFKFSKMRPVYDFQRTIYLPVIRTAAQPGAAALRDVFDFPQPAQFAGKRSETAVPTQSLFLINSSMMRARATEMAALLTRSTDSIDARLDSLWLHALSRTASRAEKDDAAVFLSSMPADKAWIELAHALLSSNEFLLRL